MRGRPFFVMVAGMRLTIALTVTLLLAACGEAPVATPTEQENAQLDEAENMLDELSAEPAGR